jgi:pectate lyase
VSLRKVVNGSFSTLASAAIPVNPATWYQLRLDAIGSNLRAYVNGNLVLEAADGSHASGNSGPVMFKAATDYDDFLAYQP